MYSKSSRMQKLILKTRPAKPDNNTQVNTENGKYTGRERLNEETNKKTLFQKKKLGTKQCAHKAVYIQASYIG